MGGEVVSLIHHLIPGNLLMLPVLRLPAKRALPALVPLVAADGLAALADDHAAALADAVTVLCAEVAKEQVIDFRVGGRQMDADRLRADVPGLALLFFQKA